MSRTLVRDLRDHLDETVTVCGWVNALRLQRKMQFVILRDRSGMVQVTHKRGGEGDDLEQVIESLTDESAVAITGRVVDNSIVNLGGLEMVPERVEVLGRAEAPLPIDEHSGPEHRLNWRPLDVRLRPAAQDVRVVSYESLPAPRRGSMRTTRVFAGSWVVPLTLQSLGAFPSMGVWRQP